MASDTGCKFEQLQKLEELFARCKYPNEEQIAKWSKELGMDPDQIMCWIKNKLLLTKIEETRLENNAPWTENAKIQLENLTISKRLEDRPKCSMCSKNEALLQENAKLREEHKRVTNILLGILQNRELHRLQEDDTKQD